MKNEYEDVTVTIPALARGWVLDGISRMTQSIQDHMYDMDEFPEEYTREERRAAEAVLSDLMGVYRQVYGE